MIKRRFWKVVKKYLVKIYSRRPANAKDKQELIMQKRYPYNFWKDINNVKKVLLPICEELGGGGVASTTCADIIEEVYKLTKFTTKFTTK